jgi:ligand-binding sensor domain-containing protein/GAF domain-containing protein
MRRYAFLGWSAVLCWLWASCTGRAATAFSVLIESDAVSPSPAQEDSIIIGGRSREWDLENGQAHFDSLSIQDGLSNDLVYTLYQDSLGYLWIGTADGLNRYDGYSFQVFKHEPADPNSLSSSVIYSVYEDRQGHFWVGTGGSGLNRFDRQTGRFIRYQHDPEDPDSLSNDIVYCIYEDRNGNLWVGTFGGGLDLFDRQAGKFFHFLHDPANAHSLTDNHVISIYEDDSGSLWLPTMDGLNRFDPSTKTFFHYQYDPGDPFSLSSDVTTAVLQDRWGDLWIGTRQGGLNRLEAASGRFTHYQHDSQDSFSLSHNDVFALLEDSEGHLWVGTLGGGVNLYDRDRDRFVRYQHQPTVETSLSDDFVFSIFEDRAGTIWIGTNSEISKYDPERAKFRRNPVLSVKAPDLSQQAAGVLFEDSSGSLWIGSEDGLWRIDSQSGEAHHYQHDPEDPDSLTSGWVSVIHEDREGVLWIGSGSSGIDRFDRSTGKFIHYQRSLQNPLRFREDNITSTYEDRSGNLWFGTGSGLSLYNRPDNEFTHFHISADRTDRLSKDRIATILEDQEGVLWLGTSGYGLVQFDRERMSFIHSPSGLDSLEFEQVNILYEDSQGRMWIGSQGDGLVQFDRRTGGSKSFSEKEGLQGNSVLRILEDGQGYLWILTNAGLSKFDPDQGLFENYDISGSHSQNLYSSTGCIRRNGEMLVGGAGGILAFDPEGLRLNPYRPPIVLTFLRADNEVLFSPGSGGAFDEVTLSWPSRDFEFEFAALSFTHPQKNQYAYQLEGYDGSWNYTGNRRFGQYTSLPGGSYILRLKGSNNEGVWNEAGTSIPIKIVPPFWGTWAFRSGSILLLFLAITAAYRWRVRHMDVKRRELAQQLLERTEALAALNEITATISQSPDLTATLAGALEKTLQVVKIESGGIYLLDERNGLLRITTCSGLADDFIEKIDDLQMGEGFSGQVVQSGQPLVVEDLMTDPRLTRQAVVEEGMRSVAIVPLISKGRTLGTLFAITRGFREFEPLEIELLSSIGQQIGVALENARLYEQMKHKLAQLVALQETNQAVVSTLDLDQLLNLIVQQATTLLQAEGGILNLVDWEELEDEVYACTGTTSDVLGIRSRLDSSFAGWSALHNQAEISNRLQDDPRAHSGLLQSQLHNAAVAPLSIKDRVIGTLVVIDKLGGAGEFDGPDLDLLVAFANLAAAALENARLYSDLQHRLDQFRVIAEVGRRVALILDVDEVLRQVIRVIQQAFGYYHVGIGLVEEDEVVYRFGLGNLWSDPDFNFSPARLKIGREGLTGWVAATGKPLSVPNVEEEPRYVGMLGSATRSELVVPIIVKERVIGVLDAQSDRLNAFDETDLMVLQALAHQAGAAIENARLFHAEKRRAEQFRVIGVVGQQITSGLSVDNCSSR